MSLREGAFQAKAGTPGCISQRVSLFSYSVGCLELHGLVVLLPWLPTGLQSSWAELTGLIPLVPGQARVLAHRDPPGVAECVGSRWVSDLGLWGLQGPSDSCTALY